MNEDTMIATLSRLAVRPTPGINPLTVKASRDVLAEHGLDRALGWIDGYWYGTGNQQATGNPTWRAIRATLGVPVPD